jgi:DAACS family dicarboxylate/amino acid:cation (Na+ or H+) symporter
MAESRRGVSLQMQMLIGFVVGLTAGLIVYMTQPGAPWVQACHDLRHRPDRPDFPAPAVHAGHPLAVRRLGGGHCGDGGHPIPAPRRHQDFALHRAPLEHRRSARARSGERFEPGAGIDQTQATAMLEKGRENAGSIISSQEDKPQGVAAVLAIIPNNVFKAMADNDILAVMFFALIFGIGLLLVNTPTTNALQRGIEGLFQVAMKLISLVIRLAPIAIACFMFNLAAIFGWDLLQTLALYVGVVLLALGIQMFVVYPAAIALIARRSPLQFFRDIQAAMVVAFSTASSNATLPTSLKVADENLRLPGPVARFVLTIGATANQNGTAIFEGVTVLFLAQFFGVELSIWQQVTVLLMCILAGIGTAGVPAGSLPVVAIILAWSGRSGRDRPGARRRPAARHVPHHAQRHRRPRHRRDGSRGEEGWSRHRWASAHPPHGEAGARAVRAPEGQPLAAHHPLKRGPLRLDAPRRPDTYSGRAARRWRRRGSGGCARDRPTCRSG